MANYETPLWCAPVIIHEIALVDLNSLDAGPPRRKGSGKLRSHAAVSPFAPDCHVLQPRLGREGGQAQLAEGGQAAPCVLSLVGSAPRDCAWPAVRIRERGCEPRGGLSYARAAAGGKEPPEAVVHTVGRPGLELNRVDVRAREALGHRSCEGDEAGLACLFGFVVVGKGVVSGDRAQLGDGAAGELWKCAGNGQEVGPLAVDEDGGVSESGTGGEQPAGVVCAHNCDPFSRRGGKGQQLSSQALPSEPLEEVQPSRPVAEATTGLGSDVERAQLPRRAADELQQRAQTELPTHSLETEFRP